MVEKPVAVRYGWAVSPHANLKVGGHPECPLPSFRADSFDFLESEDPGESLAHAGRRERGREAEERLKLRLEEEAKQAMEIFTRLQKLGRVE